MSRVILLTFDRLHTGYLGCYGNDWIETPNWDRLAAEGVVFDEHFANEIEPAFAGEAWWKPITGLSAPGSEPAPDLCEQLRAAGIPTFCLCEADPTESARRLPEFDVFVPIPVDDGERLPENQTSWGVFARHVSDWLKRNPLPETCLLWLHSRGIPEPWYPPAEYADLYFAEFGLADDEEEKSPAATDEEENADDDTDDDDTDDEEETASEFGEDLLDEEPQDASALSDVVCDHRDNDQRDTNPREDEARHDVDDTAEGPFEADDELQRRLARALYAAAATALDRATGRIVSALRDAGVFEEALLILTAARGQSLGERTPVGVEPDLPHAELAHTPLLIRGPRADWPGTRRRSLVQPSDVRELILDWFLSGNGKLSGQASSRLSSILGLSAEESARAAAVPDRAETIITTWQDHGWMIRDRDTVYLAPHPLPSDPEAESARLYHLPADRHEFAESLAQSQEDARRLWTELRKTAECAEAG